MKVHSFAWVNILSFSECVLLDTFYFFVMLFNLHSGVVSRHAGTVLLPKSSHNLDEFYSSIPKVTVVPIEFNSYQSFHSLN